MPTWGNKRGLPEPRGPSNGANLHFRYSQLGTSPSCKTKKTGPVHCVSVPLSSLIYSSSLHARQQIEHNFIITNRPKTVSLAWFSVFTRRMATEELSCMESITHQCGRKSSSFTRCFTKPPGTIL